MEKIGITCGSLIELTKRDASKAKPETTVGKQVKAVLDEFGIEADTPTDQFWEGVFVGRMSMTEVGSNSKRK